MRYGFIGLGRMGLPMAKNLLKHNHELLVYDTNPAAIASLGLKSSKLHDFKDLETIITMLPNSEHVEGTYAAIPLTKNTMRKCIDCSTIDPFRSIALGKSISAAGQGTFIDAPVSGGVAGATAGTLTFMIGSSDGTIQELLAPMGKAFHYCGEAGSGLSAKLVNNYLLALNNLATAEAMMLGRGLGLEPSILGKVINSSTGYCWPSVKNNPVLGITPGAPVERDFEGGFGIELMIKDLMLAGEAAQKAGLILPSYEAALGHYRQTAKSYSGKDFGVVMKYFESLQ